MTHPREAAVLILLLAVDGETHLLFTKRTAGLKEHSGEMCFPGGMREDGETPLQTALRETSEELGISAQDVSIVDQLKPVNTFSSQIDVNPFVGRLRPGVSLQADPVEVEEIVVVPLRVLLDPDTRRVEIYRTDEGEREVHFYDYRHYEIWGATARILNQFLERYPAMRHEWSADR